MAKGKKSKVGYRNPPKEHQFKAGTSGNPKGRRPGSENRKTFLREVLEERVDVRLGRKPVRMTRFEVIVRAQVKKAVNGDNQAGKLIDDWAEYIGFVKPEVEPTLGRGGVVTFSEYAAYLKEMGLDPDW